MFLGGFFSFCFSFCACVSNLVSGGHDLMLNPTETFSSWNEVASWDTKLFGAVDA